MDLALSRDCDGPEFACVTKRLRDKDGFPIGTEDENPILYSLLYEVEYLDGYKEPLADNYISENLYSQIDQEGNIFVSFY